MPDLQLDDVSLYYELDGSGPPLLMIAGMLSDSASWGPAVPLLEDHFTLIRPDNRTAGRTTPVDTPVSVPLIVQDCVHLLDHLGLAKVHVIGHSLGGMIGLLLAQTHPERIANLTLAASAPMRLARNLAIFETLLSIRRSNAPAKTWLLNLFPWLFAPSFFDNPDAAEQAAATSLAYPFAQSVNAMAHQLEMLREFDPTQLKQSVPTQALLGKDDLMFPVELAKVALGGIPAHLIANAGHSIHWDAPQAVCDALISFTKTHPL